MNDITETTIQDIIKKIQKESNLDNKSIFDELVQEFKSIKDASCFYNISYRSLCMHLRGKTKSCGKMIWKYKNN